jgi:hypothetical protein
MWQPIKCWFGSHAGRTRKLVFIQFGQPRAVYQCDACKQQFTSNEYMG